MANSAERGRDIESGIRESSEAKRSWRVRDSELNEPESKRDYNRKLFSIVAPKYDAITRLLSLGGDLLWKRRLIRLLPSDVPADLLDIATGTGDIAESLAERYSDRRIHALDLNPEMLARARSRLRRFGARTRALEADMAHMPFADGSMSVVTGGYALRNAPSLEAAVSEVARVLEPGGTAVFLEFSRSASPLLFAVQFRLLRLWGHFWGLLLHGDPEVYAYIARSLTRFPDRRRFHRMLASYGLPVRYAPRLYFGVLELTVCRKAS
ncbi:MAG: class I SAM-dependent methyltransferase [Spirochaetales bacterium]